MAQQPITTGASGTASQGMQSQGMQSQGMQSQGVQPGGGGMQMATQRGPGLTVDEGLTEPTRVALHDVIKAHRVCEWCADQCLDEGPEMARCVRLCRDVADLSDVTAEFLIRKSIFAPDVAQTFAEAAEECARECSQHSHEHCQECARVLPRAAETVRELAAAMGQPQPLPTGGQ